jgi:hypothetical protein
MMIRRILLLVCLISNCAVPIANGQTAARTPQPTDTQKQLDALTAKVDKLDGKVRDLLSSTEKLQAAVLVYRDLLKAKEDSHRSIVLDPSSRVFQRLDSDGGYFLVSIQSITPYLNGYKVMLNVGNPLAADFRDATFSAKWAKDLDSSPEAPAPVVHHQDFQVATPLRSGKWNTVELDLIPAAPDELGILTLSVAAKTVGLVQVPQSE